MSIRSKFSIRSGKVAGRFLQSAVIVDDKPHFRDRPQSVVSPGRGRRPQTQAQSESTASVSDAAMHDLDAGRLINAFAELGIVCAVLKPEFVSADAGATAEAAAVETLSARTHTATKRADIVILDWNILNEDRPGQTAKRLVQDILRTDESTAEATRTDDHSRRLRLIVIYTGDKDLDSITGEMADLLEGLKLGAVYRSTYHVTAGHVTIAVYGKGTPIIQGADAERRVEETELPERLCEEFAKITAGLLSNAALEALSAIRTNTHRILSRFNPGMDAPYVAHRAMMEPPEEAEEHPVPLIASEIEGVLADDVRIRDLVGFEALAEWLDDLALQDDIVQARLEMSAREFKQALLGALRQGLARSGKEQNHPKWEAFIDKLNSYDRKAASVITHALAEKAEEMALDMEFARLTSLRSQYDSPPPILRLGSIVKTKEGGNVVYLLCIQPLCDSVRLDRARGFPFLKLKDRSADQDKPFDFVVIDGGSPRRLYVSRKAYDVVVVSMKPDSSSQLVKATLTNNIWQFQRTGSGSPLHWLADLKPDFAHRVVNEFVSQVARVGLTESEWLRRMARTGLPVGNTEAGTAGPGTPESG